MKKRVKKVLILIGGSHKKRDILPGGKLESTLMKTKSQYGSLIIENSAAFFSKSLSEMPTPDEKIPRFFWMV